MFVVFVVGGKTDLDGGRAASFAAAFAAHSARGSVSEEVVGEDAADEEA